MTQGDFDAPSWTPVGDDETYGRFMRIRHFDCTMHEQDIRATIGAPSPLEPEALRSCLDEVETGLGYIVGRRAGAPDGSRVRIDLSGPVPTSYSVVVDGRAAVVPSFEGEPTVGLEMPADLFLRLTGGGPTDRRGFQARSGGPAIRSWRTAWSPISRSPSDLGERTEGVAVDPVDGPLVLRPGADRAVEGEGRLVPVEH